MKKVIAFDLDGTLADSKSPLSNEMSGLICQLLARYHVAIVSGGAFAQFKKQILDTLDNPSEEILGRLLLMPTNSASLYVYRNKAWHAEYEETLTDEEKKDIAHAWERALAHTDIVLPNPSYGPVMEDRGAQMSFSACGQQAPIAVKSVWDPDGAKRMALREVMLPLLPEFTVNLGGMSTLDVTKKGIDKEHAINKIIDYLQVSKSDIMFIGDKLEPGGNDYPAKRSGVDCVAVSDPNETADFIRQLLQ
jgi:HAD superfamily hydrolase (TIGR01484 family)